MKLFFAFVLSLAGLLVTPAHAGSAQSVGRVKLDLIHHLEEDGTLSAQQAASAKLKYVTPEELSAAASAPPTGSPALEGFISLIAAGALFLFLWRTGPGGRATAAELKKPRSERLRGGGNQ